jgi:hypothetical protein
MAIRPTVAAGILMVAGCHHASPSPRLNVQHLCGEVVAAEVSVTSQDLWSHSSLVLQADQSYLLRFDPSCRGVQVSPSPESVLQATHLPGGRVSQVRGPDGLIAGGYQGLAGDTIRLTLTKKDGTQRHCVVRFTTQPGMR